MSRRSYSVGIIAIFVLCALILTSLSGMFAPIPSKSRTASSDGWIVGQVTNGTGPIKDAYILYVLGSGSSGPIGSTWTDAAGNYNLTVLGGVSYSVVAFDGSYYSAGAGAAPAAGESAWANLTMNPIAPVVADVVLTGFVLDGTGNPVPGGNVAGIVNDPNTGGQGFPMYGNMTTADPSTGRYTVNVIPGSLGGGTAALDFSGYKFIANTTQNPFVSGQTYWINITLSNPPSMDDAVLSGTVTDGSTGAPLANAVVTVEPQNQGNNQGGNSNSTFTNAYGQYEINVTNGSSRITFQKLQYCMYQVNNLAISHGAHIILNATLLATNATVSGNVTDLKTGLPMGGVTVYIVDSMTNNTGHFTSTTTNSAGEYTLDAFVSSPESIGAQQTGYLSNNSMLIIDPGDHLRIDIGLWPLNAWLVGNVTDFFSGTPIAYADVSLQSTEYSNRVSTEPSGAYNISLLSGNYSIQVNAMNYSSYSGTVDVNPGMNTYDIVLMPMNLPHTTKLYGWVNDSVSNLGIPNAQVRVGLAGPYNNGNTMQTNTNNTGYYEMMVPPLELEFIATAQNHIHAQETVNATGQTQVWINVALEPDLWGPNVTYDQSPTQNISWTNPSWINVTAQVRDPQQFVMGQFMFANASNGHSDYALVQMLYDSFDPLNNGMNNLPFTKSGDNYSLSYLWTATATGGWLVSGSVQQYFGSIEMQQGPNAYQGLKGQYYNFTLGSSHEGTAWFDNTTGDFAFFTFNEGFLPTALPSDPTGTFSPEVSVLWIDNFTNNPIWYGSLTEGSWSVVGLHFVYDGMIPSGGYISLFSVQDFGNRGTGNFSMATVDNDPPVANAGSDQTVPAGQTVYFDGSSSTDNVGITNYTWTFNDGGTPVTLWGPNPSYTFLTEGVYNVTLTVRDGAGHTSTDVVRITISAAIPEFPTVIIPISGMILIVALVRVRRSRLDE